MIKSVGKQPAFNLQKEKDIFIEARKDVGDSGASTSRAPQQSDQIPVLDMPPFLI